MLEKEPNDLFLKYALGMEYLGEGDDNSAEKYFRAVILADEHYVSAYYQLGMLAMKRRKDAEALEILQKGLHEAQQKKDLKTINEFRALIDQID